jgi:membrane protein implicated in regulation of membrane protease activity
MGWPVALVLLALGLPLLAVLALLGFPFFVVFGLTAVMLALLGAVLTVGLIALKVFVFVVLPVLLVVKLSRWIWRSLRGKNGVTVHAAPAPEVPA